jgi:predicted ATPase/class 3 adenylate cyclase
VRLAAIVCATCGAPAAEDARFCSRCGAALAPAQVSETRRVVTSLFADVVGSTSLAEQMDPEDFRALMEDLVARMVAAVDGLGGTIEHLAGDGVLALFGAPVAHEDDAERAVLAGLRIVADIGGDADGAATRYSIEPPAVRVGIETGLAVVGPVDAGGHARLAATGDSLNTAARLQAAARPGTVLVGERTWELVEARFDWGDRHELELKGKADPVSAVEATAPATRGAAVPGPGARLVGRDQELEDALKHVHEVLAGRGGLLLIFGEPGIGKTRLLRELCARFDGARSPVGEPLWLAGRCASYGESLPYLPFRGVLGDWLGVPPSDPEIDADALAPILGFGAEVQKLDPEDVQHRAFDAVRTLLERRAREGPVMLVLDDMQWADSSSVALLEYLLPTTREAALLIIVAARLEHDGPGPGLRRAAGESHARDLTLEPLHGEADRDLLSALVGPGTLPLELERRVLERAEGNPFYLEELVGSLLQSGALERSSEGFRFVGRPPVEVPETIERLVLARIDRLAPGSGEVLRAASVLGRRFDEPLLEAVVGGTGVGEELQELRRHDLIRGEPSAPRREYRFKHSLIQETAYGSLLRRRQQELHGRAALALERLSPERHGLLAHHYSAAGQDEPALAQHTLAAKAAFGMYALDEALDHCARATRAAERLGAATEDRRVGELLRVRGNVRFYRGDLAGGAEDAQAALAAARATGDRRLEMRALTDLSGLRHHSVDQAVEYGQQALRIAESLGDVEATILSLSRLSILLANRLRLDAAVEHAERALRLADRARNDRMVGRALDAIKLVAFELGDLRKLEEVSQRAAAIHRRLDDRFYLSYTMLESAFVPLAGGGFAAARERLDEALALNAALGDRSGRPLFLDALCWLERSRGDYRAALNAGLEGYRIARAGASEDWLAWSASGLGWTLLELGEMDSAAEVLREGLAAVEGTGAAVQLVRCAGLLAAAECEVREVERAARQADRVEALLGRMTAPPGGTFLYGAHAQLAVAHVRLSQGDAAAAERLSAPLLAAADHAGWLETVARAATALGGCRLLTGDRAGSKRLLLRAVSVAGDAGFPAAERAARMALARLLFEDDRPAEGARHEDRAADLDERIRAGIAEGEPAVPPR